MKTLALLACLILTLPACSFLPPVTGTAPTARQETISADLDAVASAIRKAEGSVMTPVAFNAFLDNYVALLPQAVPYLPDAKLAYAILYAGGNATVAGLEKLATAYDSK